MERPDDVKIREGRLLRKIEKLKTQRDYFKTQLAHYEKVISMQPYLETRYQTYTEKVEERKRVKALELRVEEQAALIKILRKQNETT